MVASSFETAAARAAAVRHPLRFLRSLVAGSGQLRAVRMLTSASPALAAAAFVFVIAEGVLPNLVIVAMGRVTGHITGAVENGLGSPAGHG